MNAAERIYEFADSLEDSTPVAEEAIAQWETWVRFWLNGEVFGFPVDVIQEIVRVGQIIRVPHAPYAVRGICNLRGRVVPVVDLRVRLGLPAAELTDVSRILIASSRGRLLGLLVDAVEQIQRVDRNRVLPPPADVVTEHSEYITGVYQHDAFFLLLLDAERVLLVPEALEARNALTINT